MSDHKFCEELTLMFNKFYPGGHTNFRGPSLGTAPYRVFVKEAKGSRIWDIDGAEYLDFSCALGPTILGHRNPDYVNALKDLLDHMSPLMGSGFLFSPDDVEIAKRLTNLIPCAESVKFNLSGSDAVQMAIRLARAYTGRKRIIRFAGHYHGWIDNILGGQVTYTPGDPGKLPIPYYDPKSTPEEDDEYTAGRSEWAAQESFMLPYNDIGAFEEVVERYHDEIAMVHFEGIVCNHLGMKPYPGFVEKIRELCTKYGIIMSMDEVITGFRIGLQGAQGYLGVTPDIATFGKSIAGGMPVSAVLGKKELLEPLADASVLGPGTFNGYPLGGRAVLATLNILEKDEGAVYKEMARVQKNLTNELADLAKRLGVPAFIQQVPGVFFFLLGLERDEDLHIDADLKGWDQKKQIELRSLVQGEGVLHLRNGRFYMSIAHTDKDVLKLLDAMKKALKKLY